MIIIIIIKNPQSYVNRSIQIKTPVIQNRKIIVYFVNLDDDFLLYLLDSSKFNSTFSTFLIGTSYQRILRKRVIILFLI